MVICPNCRTPNQADLRNCYNCGQLLIGRKSNTWVVLLAIVLVGGGLIAAFAGSGIFSRASSVTSTPIVRTSQPAPPLSELITKKQELTDAQWDAYADTLQGRRITDWGGVVENVDNKPLSEFYVVTVNVEEPLGAPAFDLRWDVNRAEALTYSKGQKLTVSGTIRAVDCVLTYCPIDLHTVSVSTP